MNLNLNGTYSMTLGNYPEKISYATGGFINDTVLVCGGDGTYYASGDKCYSISKGQRSFEFKANMAEERIKASNAILQEKMWLTGGHSGHAQYITKSTEFIKPDKNLPKIDLPEPIYSHTITYLNDTTSILIGGCVSISDTPVISDKTYFFNHLDNTWTNGASLLKGRREHTAGVIKDLGNDREHIVVVGGRVRFNTNVYLSTDSVEIMLSGTNVWTEGTNIPYICCLCLFE